MDSARLAVELAWSFVVRPACLKKLPAGEPTKTSPI
jgi:hypothetical protein